MRSPSNRRPLDILPRSLAPQTTSRLRPNEVRLIARLNTPLKVQRYVNALAYNQAETMRTFRGVVVHKTAHCMEAALFAAVTLEQHGYPPLLLDIGSQDGLDHVLFLYQHNGRFGTVARSRDPGLHGRKPQFSSLRELVDSYAAMFVDMSGRVISFADFDLRSVTNYDWRLSSRNVWHIERTLIARPHQPYRMPDRDYEYWYARYEAFKEKHPADKPIFYPNRRRWKPGYPRR